MDGAPEVDHAALIRSLQAPRWPLVVYTVHAGDELAARAVHDVVKGAGVRRAGVAAVRRRGLATTLYRLIEWERGRPFSPAGSEVRPGARSGLRT